MPVVESIVSTFVVKYQCDACGTGEMRWTNMTLTMDPPAFPHVCNACGATQDLPEPYPVMVTRVDQPDAT